MEHLLLGANQNYALCCAKTPIPTHTSGRYIALRHMSAPVLVWMMDTYSMNTGATASALPS
jgi:hypothetical protein